MPRLRVFAFGMACALSGTPLALAQSTPQYGPAQVHVALPSDMAPGQPSAQDASAIAEKLQNPVGDLISVPFQNNTNFNVGPHKGTQDILNIQPVIPIHVTPNWNIITRTILPLVWSPSYQPAQSVPPFGLAPITFSAFLSPKNPVHGWVLGRRSDRRVADHHKPDARFECLGRRPGIRGRAARQPLGFRGTG